MQTISLHPCHGGRLGYYAHDSAVTHCRMRFTVFVPPQAKKNSKRPTVFYLSGLTCTEDNFTVKAGAYRMAAELGLIIVAPDTSPRGPDVYQSPDGSLGQGASYYVDATQEPWRRHVQMETYITNELYALVLAQFPMDASRTGIMGHSMGGHGALTLALKYPEQYRSVSALAPVCSAARSPGGRNAFSHYLGNDEAEWHRHDAVSLLLEKGPLPRTILIDQGSEDPFRDRLNLSLYEGACVRTGQSCLIRRPQGYDHSYFFVQSFIDDHLRHHAATLGA